MTTSPFAIFALRPEHCATSARDWILEELLLAICYCAGEVNSFTIVSAPQLATIGCSIGLKIFSILPAPPFLPFICSTFVVQPSFVFQNQNTYHISESKVKEKSSQAQDHIRSSVKSNRKPISDSPLAVYNLAIFMTLTWDCRYIFPYSK